MRSMHILGLGIALLPGLLGGCGGSDEQTASKPHNQQPFSARNAAVSRHAPTGPASNPGQSAPSGVVRTPEQVQRILALPYTGWVEEDDGLEDGLVYRDEARSCAGYTLFTVQSAAAALLVDHAGKEVHRWQDPAAQHWMHVELLADGDVLVIGADQPVEASPGARDRARYAMRLDWAGGLVWKKHMLAHHDITTTPDGNLLTLVFQKRRLSALHLTKDVQDELISILSPQGEILDSLSVCDALLARPGVYPLLKMRPAAERSWIDLFHANSLEWLHHGHLLDQDPIYGPDNVLVCFRHQNRVAIFDMKKREVVWAWGQRELSAPHDAQMLENGHVLLFDNGVKRGWSRVVELDPLREEIVWQYIAPTPTDFYTRNKGSAQRLPNGNTLIANSNRGEIFEVTPGGAVVWRYLCPERNKKGRRAAIVRATRFESAFVERLLARFAKEPG